MKKKPATVIPPAPLPLTGEQQLDRIVKSIERKLKSAHLDILSFTKDLEKSPAYAFEWSQKAFDAAATIQVFQQVMRGLTDEDGVPRLAVPGKDVTTIQHMTRYAQAEVNRRATVPRGSSSSTTSNLMESATLAAWARIVDLFLWN